MKFLLLISLAILAVSQGKEIGIRNYEGYQVFRVESTNDEQAEIIKQLYDSDSYDFWSTAMRIGTTDIMASSEQAKYLSQLFEKNGMKYEVSIKDVEGLIQQEREMNKRSQPRMDWTSYPRYAEIESWLTTEVNNSPVAQVSSIGNTFEGRNIYVVKISTGGPNKKAILIDANIHAREWISGATATWIINELVTNTDQYQEMLDEVDFYIVPFINVDGYEYSQTRDRMWRKTRSTQPSSNCFGVDPNRNFAFHFGGEGTSPNPCSDTYKGEEAFSEPETAAIRDFVHRKEAEGVRFYSYLTFHSYGQMWLLQWGYTKGHYPVDYSEQLSLGQAAAAALRAVYGTSYQVGQGADILYGVGGASDDWAKHHGIKFTATLEMRDTGRYGFILPADQIIPNAQEVWAAVRVVADRVRETTLP